MSWQKPKIFYQHGLFGLTATSAESGYPVSNLLNRLEGNWWKATSTATQDITFDAGAGNTCTADYLAISGHNLKTAGATIAFECSSDNFGADITQCFTAFAPSHDRELVKEFASQTKRYWRIKLSGMTVAPSMAIAHWGQGAELDYCNAELDPHGYEFKVNENVSPTGILQAVHRQYEERTMTLKWEDADDALYQKLKALVEAVGLLNFFIGWELQDHPDDVYLMRLAEKKWINNLTNGGAYRDITMKLKGRKQ